MTNVINQTIAEKKMKDSPAYFSYDTSGRTRPRRDKAQLLPSRLIGSPIEYAKDTFNDIRSIGKAVKGTANDYELGRLNWLAVKLGSLGIASYLCAKSPAKGSKAMEFAGFGAFFASMALWPKLAIQLPLKMRTGVDFMQEYRDSQGLKKKLYQDPQYVLTDMLPRKDLEKIGKKMGVDENLPDRNNFIKQRARKTALQANTLWMASAGFAAPVMTALICNAAKEPVTQLAEKIELEKTRRALLSDGFPSRFEKAGFAAKEKKFDKFLKLNADSSLDGKAADTITNAIVSMLDDRTAEALKAPIREALSELAFEPLTEDKIKTVLNFDAVSMLDENQTAGLRQFIRTYNAAETPDVRQQAAGSIAELFKETGLLGSMSEKDAVSELMKPRGSVKIKDVSDDLAVLYNSFVRFAAGKRKLDRFIDARAGERAGSYIANEWGRAGSDLINALNFDNMFTAKELKKAAGGDRSVILKHLDSLISDDAKYTEIIGDLAYRLFRFDNLTKDETTLPNSLMTNIRLMQQDELRCGLENRMQSIFGNLKNALLINPRFSVITDVLTGAGGTSVDTPMPGTLHAGIVKDAEARVHGARSALYRLVQCLDILKRAKTGDLETDVKTALGNVKVHDNLSYLDNFKLVFEENYKKECEAKNISFNAADFKNALAAALDEKISALVQVCKDAVLTGAPVDYVEKFTTKGFKLPESEFKAVMTILFPEKIDDLSPMLKEILSQHEEKAIRTESSIILGRILEYCKETRDKAVNYKNPVTPDFSKAVLEEAEQIKDSAKRSGFIGKNIFQLISEAAQVKYNSKTWLMKFGGIMAVIAAAAAGAGLLLGRKDKTEQIAEDEFRKSRTNG